MDALLDELTCKYGVNEPIFEKAVCVCGMSPDVLHHSLAGLVKDKQLALFAKGIYYIPTETPFGQSRLSVRQVLEQKYIGDKNKVWGYYTGIKLQNLLGLTEQVPAVIEVATNIEKSKSRAVILGGQRIILRKPRVLVTAENVAVLQLLDLMNRFEMSQFSHHRIAVLRNFIQSRDIQMTAVRKILRHFPSKAAKNLICSGIINEIA